MLPLLPHCLRHLFRPQSLVSASRCTSFPRGSATQLPRHPNKCILVLPPFTSAVPFSASSYSYFLLTLSLYSTIISSLHFHYLIFFGPIVLFSFHFFMRTSKTTGLCCVVTYFPAKALQSFTLLSCCCRTTSRSSSVLCRPLLWVILWLSFFLLAERARDRKPAPPQGSRWF